jgi:NitT/TauT family transport system substrate-binding protein
MGKLTRRDVVLGAAAGAAMLVDFPTPAILHAQEAVTAKWATATPGFTVVFYDYIRDNKLDQKYGLRFPEPILNSSIGTLFNDFVAGSYELMIASWDPILVRQQAGVPCQLLCTLMTADMIGIVATKSGPARVADLKGKTVAAPQQSGVYRMTRAFLKEFDNIDIEAMAQVQNADNPAQGVTLVIADRADAAVAWEPMISSGMVRRPDLNVVYNAGEIFRTKTSLDLPYFCVNVRKELLARAPDMTAKLNAMFAECVAGIDANFDQVADKYAARALIDASVLKAAKKAGRLRFKYGAASDPLTQKTITTASEILVRQGVLTKPADATFFAS